MLIKPKHTFASTVRLLAEGLADGSIELDTEPEIAGRTSSNEVAEDHSQRNGKSETSIQVPTQK